MKKITKLATVIATAALLVSGCAAGGDSPEPTDTATPEWTPEWVDGVLQPLPDGFPNKPITLIQSAGPEQGVHLRHLAPVIERMSGQSVRTQDRPDFNSSDPLMMAHINSDRDGAEGYLWGIGTIGASVTRMLNTSVAADMNLTLDSWHSMIIEEVPWLIVTRPDAPFQDLDGFIEYAKDHPGELRNLSRPPGSATALALDIYLHELGLDVQKIVGGSQQELAVALAAGEGEIMINLLDITLPHLETGRLKVIACTGSIPCDYPWGTVPLMKDVVDPDGVDPWASHRVLNLSENIDPLRLAWIAELMEKVLADEDLIAARSTYPGVTVHFVPEEETKAVWNTYRANAFELLKELGQLDPTVTE